jgi:hypothetical protein
MPFGKADGGRIGRSAALTVLTGSSSPLDDLPAAEEENGASGQKEWERVGECNLFVAKLESLPEDEDESRNRNTEDFSLSYYKVDCCLCCLAA